MSEKIEIPNFFHNFEVKTKIWITTQFEGFHRYPEAPEGVEFLKYPHRHIFKLKVWIDVYHDDRDIEFILFKRFIDSVIKDTDFDYMSCEMISDRLFEEIGKKHPGRSVWIEVSEDGENGSYKEYNLVK